MEPNRWGQARIEVTALKSLILKRLTEGYSIRRIWTELRADRKITVGRSAFTVQVEKICKADMPDSEQSAPSSISRTSVVSKPAPAPQQEAPKTISQFHLDPVSEPLVLKRADEDANQREQDSNAN